MTEIKFYNVAHDYGEFSNFAPYPIRLKGKNWPTTEHYFQAQKFARTRWEEAIRKAKTPGQAARMGRDRTKRLRKNWESIKISIMRDALIAKFTQHENLRELLISTEDATIIEHTENDDFWGDGGDGSGKNMLGQLLMEIREKIRNQ